MFYSLFLTLVTTGINEFTVEKTYSVAELIVNLKNCFIRNRLEVLVTIAVLKIQLISRVRLNESPFSFNTDQHFLNH